MPSSKKDSKKKSLQSYASKMRVAQSLSKRKGLKGGKPCPTGSQKVCIKKGDLVKLLKKASIKTRKTKKVKLNKRKLQKTMRTRAERMPATEEKQTTLLGSIFGAEEEPVKKEPVKKEPVVEEEPVVEKPIVEEEPIVEKPIVEESKEVEEKPSFIESIFGSEEKKKPEKKPEESQV